MAYNAVSQSDQHEVTSNTSDQDNRGGDRLDAREPIRSLGSMIRSMTAMSYETVEDDDYEEIAADHAATRKSIDPPTTASDGFPRPLPPPINTAAATRSDSTEEPALRTPISDVPVPLSHPTPDLQSLQGAYVNNVERLEQSAERMSCSSADIGSEIRKMDRAQKRRSSGSTSHPVGSLDGSPRRPHARSRQASIQSAARLAQVSENGPGDPSPVPGPVLAPLLPLPPALAQPTGFDPLLPLDNPYDLDRPASAASNDTYQQARVLFTDFDGVHYHPDRADARGPRVSLTRPPLAARPESFQEPPPGERMVYYPAPVPMMLNLPPRLSQRPIAEREKRRTQLLGTVAAADRQSMAGRRLGPDAGEDSPREKAATEIAPHLRASVFFDPPAAPVLDVDVKKESAVATLESILDASTRAPVSAFTDHPFAGHLGPEVYGSARPRATGAPDRAASDSDLHSVSLTGTGEHGPSEAEATRAHEGTALRDESPGSPDGADAASAPADGASGDDVPFTGPPTTLLAELEMRKHELKQRRRTAATAGGLHSTLLQMDAVAQKQSEHRRARPVALAWESPTLHQQDAGDDEDVPLAMLFPEQAQPPEDGRPLGLMARRAMEESEPLSRRRARLRGDGSPAPAPRASDRRPVTMYAHGPAPGTTAATNPDGGDDNNEDEDEGETLGARLQRLKAHHRQSTAGQSEFASEIFAEFRQLGGADGDDDDGTGDGSPPEPADETLAQRRARLHREAAAELPKNSTLTIPRYRRSMADLLHARRPTTEGRPAAPATGGAPAPSGLGHQHTRSQLSLPFTAPPGIVPPGVAPPGVVPPGTARSTYVPPSGYGMVHPNTFYTDAILGKHPMSYAVPRPPGPPGVGRAGAGQREMIDRWRQSIV